MHTSFKFPKALEWTAHSLWFLKNHFSIIFGLGLVAAFGRATQLGAFGPITYGSHIALETIIECARLLIFLYALGLTNIKFGVIRIIQLFTNQQNRQQNWRVAFQTVRAKWAILIYNIAAFLVLSFLINYFINHIAYQTCLYANLKRGDIISRQASEWTLILFFKNISVIPLALVFNALFFLWVMDQLPKFPSHKQGI